MSRALFALLAVWAGLSGCAQPNLHGEWQTKLGGNKATVDLLPGGKLTGTGEVQGYQVAFSGTYQYDGDNLNISIGDISLNGTSLGDIHGFQFPGPMRSLSRSGRLEWKSGDEFILTANRAPSIYFDRVIGK